MEALTSPEFGTAWPAIDTGWIPANRRFDANQIENVFQRRFTEINLAALDADPFRFDASDLMPPSVNDAFRFGMERYFVDGPESAAEILAEIEAAWATFESTG